MPTGLTPKTRWTTDHLPASDRPKKFYRYFVTGRGQFPFDMLRYDAAWPATGEDAGLLYPHHERERRSVELSSYSEPTVARWSSFGWRVSAEKL